MTITVLVYLKNIFKKHVLDIINVVDIVLMMNVLIKCFNPITYLLSMGTVLILFLCDNFDFFLVKKLEFVFLLIGRDITSTNHKYFLYYNCVQTKYHTFERHVQNDHLPHLIRAWQVVTTLQTFYSKFLR